MRDTRRRSKQRCSPGWLLLHPSKVPSLTAFLSACCIDCCQACGYGCPSVIGPRPVSSLPSAERILPLCPEERLKWVSDCLDPEPLLSPLLLTFCRWIGRRYMASWGETLRLALPTGGTADRRRVRLTPEGLIAAGQPGLIAAGQPGMIAEGGRLLARLAQDHREPLRWVSVSALAALVSEWAARDVD